MQELDGATGAVACTEVVTHALHHTVEDPEGVVLQVRRRGELTHILLAEVHVLTRPLLLLVCF
jgi:hypothetical protein